MDLLKSLKETKDELFVAKNELVDTRLKLAQLKRILRLELGYEVVNPHLITKPTWEDRDPELSYLISEHLKLVDYLRENDPRYLKDSDIDPTNLSACTEYLLTAEQGKALKHLYHDRTVYRTDNEKKVGRYLPDYLELKEKHENQMQNNEVLKREIDATKEKISNFEKVLHENKNLVDNIAKGCCLHVSPRKISPETDMKSKNIMDSEALKYKKLWENSELQKQKVLNDIDALMEMIEHAKQRIIRAEAASTRSEIIARALADKLKQGKMLGKLHPESDENPPVHIAGMWNRTYQFEKVFQEGDDPLLTDNKNKNSFDMAADNRSYEAFQLSNIYHAAGTLNFKPEKEKTSVTPKKLTFATPETYTTPKCNENTYMRAKSPKFAIRPSVFSTPNFIDPDEHEKLNESAAGDCAFMSAKEKSFPLIFSSSEESNINDISDANEFLKKLSLAKTGEYYDLKSKNAFYNKEEEERGLNEINITNVNIEENPSNEKYKNNLNKAYTFSSSRKSSCISSSDLNESDDSACGTIVDNNDMTDIVLVESKNDTIDLCTSNNSVCSDPNNSKSFNNIIVSDCSTLSNCESHSKSSPIVPEDIEKYSNSKIFEELKKMGANPGPVSDHTRHVYLNQLARLMSGCAMPCDLPKQKYCPEIYLFLKDKLDMDRAVDLEQMFEEEFDAGMKKEWRDGNQRCCFNYFLLDPRVTQNLPKRAKQLSDEQIFLTFLDALFYVGKGTKGRPYSHLLKAAKSTEEDRLRSANVKRILDIWDCGLGVISLHCFQNSVSVEAYTREACIIEAVGLNNLTNVRKGDCYGLCAKLTSSRKRLIGISLLRKALQIFLLEGERPIRRRDIKQK